MVARDAPKATTFRLDPTLQAGLTVLAQLTKKPLNRLVNEAVQTFIEKRSHEVEADLEAALKRLRAARKNDPTKGSGEVAEAGEGAHPTGNEKDVPRPRPCSRSEGRRDQGCGSSWGDLEPLRKR